MAWECRRCGEENAAGMPVCGRCGGESPNLVIRRWSTVAIGCFVLAVPLFCLLYTLWSLWRG